MGRKLASRSFAATLLLLAAGCGRVPQLGSDERAFKTADALWTAVCSRRPQLVEETAARLELLHAGGTLSDDAYAALTDVVNKTKAADWDGARADLRKIWSGQRRERANAHAAGNAERA